MSAALLLCHVIVVGLLVPVADARLELAAGEGDVHIEERSDDCAVTKARTRFEAD